MLFESPGAPLSARPDGCSAADGGGLPLVSVVIPTFNGARFLAQTIESVLAQTYPRLEVLVVDDGSTDETPAIAASYAPRVSYLHQANAGTAAARNTGITQASGAFIALLDHDDLWEPRKLERQLPLFATDPQIGAAGSTAVTSVKLPGHSAAILA